jgi:hypothetical protein
MMITKNWMFSSVDVDGCVYSSPFLPPTFPVSRFAGAIRRFLPSRRDREVPYGMKGGEC